MPETFAWSGFEWVTKVFVTFVVTLRRPVVILWWIPFATHDVPAGWGFPKPNEIDLSSLSSLRHSIG
jgi:hypothetical protein